MSRISGFVPRFGSVRTRLVALLVLAAVPLIAMAAAIAWQNYDVAVSQVTQRTVLVLDAAAARHAASIGGTRLLLTAIGRSLAADSDSCDAYLQALLTQTPVRYTNLMLLDPGGGLRCSGAALPPGIAASGDNQRSVSFAGADWFAAAVQALTFRVVPQDSDPGSGLSQIIAVQPVIQSGRLLNVVVAALRFDWLLADGALAAETAEKFHLWLVTEAGRPIDVARSLGGALPAAPDLAGFIAGLARPATALSRDGTLYCYATTRLSSGLRLLVGYDAADDLSRAQHLLLARGIELGALLLLGLAAIAVGANLAVRVPLARLTEAVQRWRGGGSFETPGARLPSELRELSAAFSQATAAVSAHEMQLRGALAHQETLMQEIHHRVKNNMQIVASLLNLQAARIRQPEARAEFQSARDRVRALATLHRHLYAHGELHTINMRSFLTELCSQLFNAFGEVPGQRIRLEIDAAELRISSDQAVPLALIVTETVSNAIKYAFPDDRRGAISVSLTADTDRALLVIRDNGIGLPEGRAAREGGIGLQLVRGFVRQIGGVLTLDTTEGLSYLIDMPLRERQEEPARRVEVSKEALLF